MSIFNPIIVDSTASGRKATPKQFPFTCYSLPLLLTLVSFPNVIFAQSIPPPGVNIPPNVPDTLEQTIPKPTPSPTAPIPTKPTAPILPSPPIPAPSDTNFPSNDRFLVKKVEVLGATVLKDEIGALIQPFENSQVTFADLLKLRADIGIIFDF